MRGAGADVGGPSVSRPSASARRRLARWHAQHAELLDTLAACPHPTDLRGVPISEQLAACRSLLEAVEAVEAVGDPPDPLASQRLAQALSLYRHCAQRWMVAATEQDSAALAAAARARRHAASAFPFSAEASDLLAQEPGAAVHVSWAM